LKHPAALAAQVALYDLEWLFNRYYSTARLRALAVLGVEFRLQSGKMRDSTADQSCGPPKRGAFI